MKNLLIITQKVDFNNDILGFFHEWIREFSKRWNKVTVICLKLGEYDLPDNVKVLSLGKENLESRIWNLEFLNKTKYLFNFYKYIWRERKNYDAVFVHMNPKYVPLGWPVWKLLGKKISLWYAHGHVPLMLKIADCLTDIAFASTPEGYRLKSKKLRIVGQGIDVGLFKPNHQSPITNHQFKIVSAGRITQSKDYRTLIDAVALLPSFERVQVEILGSPAKQADADYLKEMEDLIAKNNLVEVMRFAGPVANKDIVPILQSADLFVNMGHTGSLDKAVLEAMACGLPILTCNEAYESVLGEYKEMLMYPKKDYQKLAEKIKFIIGLSDSERARMSADLREIVVCGHNLEGLINKITQILNA